MTEKDRKWLERICEASKPGSSMYCGELVDLVPGNVARRLENLGLISLSMPHNPSHKYRWVITSAGTATLK